MHQMFTSLDAFQAIALDVMRWRSNQGLLTGSKKARGACWNSMAQMKRLKIKSQRVDSLDASIRQLKRIDRKQR